MRQLEDNKLYPGKLIKGGWDTYACQGKGNRCNMYIWFPINIRFSHRKRVALGDSGRTDKESTAVSVPIHYGAPPVIWDSLVSSVLSGLTDRGFVRGVFRQPNFAGTTPQIPAGRFFWYLLYFTTPQSERKE